MAACRYAALVETLTSLGLCPLDTGDCVGEATHLASGQLRRTGLVITVSGHVCVWHAETFRTPIPNFVALPHQPLTGAHR
jgi:uncharacterized protein YjeT (DUF2065 family)